MKFLFVFTLLYGMTLAVRVQKRQYIADSDSDAKDLYKRDFDDEFQLPDFQKEDDLDVRAYAKDLEKRQYNYHYKDAKDVEKRDYDDVYARDNSDNYDADAIRK